ncbi:MAG: Hpt domain-containing protein [Steroidobacteraceae bacterium]
MSEVSSQTLDLVGRELAATVGEARNALENFIEQPENTSLLERCVEDIHQAQGVLRVLEIYGAALLAEEMEQVARYLLSKSSEQKNQAESLDALMRAIVQLPAYIERVLAGGRDLALVLLPLLNDLRAVRGSPLLSEGTLLLLNLKSEQQATPQAPEPGRPSLSVEQWSRRLRAQFQVGLIGWIRGERIDQNLNILASVARKLEQVATQQEVFQLWWVVGAVLEALRERGLDGGVSIKRLLGLADREIKRLYEIGETAYARSPPIELLNNLLYYVARTTSNGPQVSAVRASFRLTELLPVDQSIEEERENLSAPSVKLMHTVAAAIREDLGKVKDVLDIFVRRSTGKPDELGPQVEMLRKIGDTLGVLGLGGLRERIQGEIERLSAMAEGRLPVTDAALVEVASALIHVEDRLDADLVGMIVPRSGGAPVPDTAGGDNEFQAVQAAVMRECIVNLARIKEAVAQNVRGTLDVASLDAWPALVRGLKAALLILGKSRAVDIVDGLTEGLKRVMRPGGAALPPQYLDRLADSIVSLEYYLETLQAGRKDPWYMLDNAQRCLDAIAAEPDQVVPTVPPMGEETYPRTVVIEPPRDSDDATIAELTATAEPQVEPPVLAAHVTTQPAVADVDPELLAIFVEEAREEVEKISSEFPVWENNPLEHDALLVVRRSFHTLKGSGRMVGARELAEFAWAIENLLNRLIDNTLSRTRQILDTIREAVALAPRMVDDLESGGPSRISATALIARAHALAAGRDEIAPSAAESETRAGTMTVAATQIPANDGTVTPSAPAAPAAADGSLWDIYAREVGAHIRSVRSFVSAARESRAPHRVTDEVYRACHTLSGSSRAAEARHGTQLAVPLERWLRKAHENEQSLSDAEVDLIDKCMDAMEDIATHPDEPSGYFRDHDQLRQRISKAESELDARLTELAAQNERASQEEAAAQAAPAADFDPEVAAIFAEEATELLEAAESALHRFGDDGSLDALAGLKRPLHTLKGGARMAGLTSMGDLSHELETLIGRAESGATLFDASTRQLLQQSLDELARMREHVANGVAPAANVDLLRRVRAAVSGRSEAPKLAPVASVAKPVETPAHPQEPPTARSASPAQPVEAVPEPEPEPEFDPAATFVAAKALEPDSAFDFAVLNEAMPQPDAGQELPAEKLAAPAPLPPGREPAAGGERAEMARVDAILLDQLLNNAGEVSIGRSRLEQQLGAMNFNLGELSRTVTRLKEQLRKLEIETEKQILHRHEQDSAKRSDFDPLELDRYSAIQQFSRALAETASDVASIQGLLESLTSDTMNLLQQQARVVTELQNGLMRTRMVPFQRHVQRLSRIVRQAATDTGKRAELHIEGAAGELDRQVLERMLPPFEHILRNAVVHGIELPEQRRARGKPETGRIAVALRREGAEVIVDIVDDGAGIDLGAVREKAQRMGMVRAGQQLSDGDAIQLILEPGFSTASTVTQHAGRGVGMDVVATELKKLGGSLQVESKAGEGVRFTIRLPFTLAISHALVVRAGDELYALPLPTVEGVVRLSKDDLARRLADEQASFEFNGQTYRLQQLATLVGLEPAPLPDQDATIPVVMVRAGDHSTGIVAEELIGSREIVVKSVGPQIAAIRGISGATILGDGRIVVILDIGTLLRSEWRMRGQAPVARDKVDRRTFALVVDDSITVRRVTQRLLERNGMRVMTARDGMDAVAVLAEHVPDIILLDIEMPRMDGYEVAAHVRNDARLKKIPIIMITSRVGEKHRARAIELGVDDYLGKPYQEAQLLEAIEPLVSRRHDSAAGVTAGQQG